MASWFTAALIVLAAVLGGLLPAAAIASADDGGITYTYDADVNTASTAPTGLLDDAGGRATTRSSLPGRVSGDLKETSPRPALEQVAPNKPGNILGAACSFSAATEVLMADGTTRPISEVEVGDWVLAEDPETGERGARGVTHLWVHQDTLIDLEIDGHDVSTTEDHPFWNQTDGEWQRADVLDPSDLLLTADGDLLTVDGLDWGSTRTTTAYNLTVAGIHTYFVQAGDTELLVHNQCFPTPSRVVNSNMPHAAGNAVERAGLGSVAEARSALQNLSTSIKQNGFPAGTIADTVRADRVLVPFGNGGYAVYQIKPNGTAVLKTVLEAR